MNKNISAAEKIMQDGFRLMSIGENPLGMVISCEDYQALQHEIRKMDAELAAARAAAAKEKAPDLNEEKFYLLNMPRTAKSGKSHYYRQDLEEMTTSLKAAGIFRESEVRALLSGPNASKYVAVSVADAERVMKQQ